MFRLSLRVKLLVGVVLLLVPILGLLLWGVADDYERRRDMVLDRQIAVAGTIAGLVDTVFDDAIDLGWAITSNSDVRSLDPNAVAPYLRGLASRQPQYLDIEVFNAHGDSVGASLPYAPGEQSVDVADLWYFQQVMATGQPAVSEVRVARRFGGKPIGVIAVPILDGDRTIGALHLVLDLDHLPARLTSLELGPGDSFAIVDPRGRIAFHSLRPDLSWDQRDSSQLPEIRDALAGQTVRTDAFRSPLLNDVRAAGFVRSPRYGWAVAVGSPAAVVFAPIDEMLRRELAFFAVVAVVGLLGAWFVSACIARPLGLLTELARAFGRGELGRRVDFRTGDELEELARTLNAMAMQLQETTGRLEAIFTNMVEAVVIVDSRGRWIDANPAALTLLGIRREELGHLLTEYVGRLQIRRGDGTPIPAEETATARALRGEVVPAYEARLRTAFGEERFVSISSAPVRDGAGSVVFAVTVVRDVTEERRRERGRLGLARVAQRIAATPDVDEALAVATTELTASFDVALVRIWLCNEVDQTLYLRASTGLSGSNGHDQPGLARLQIGEGRVGRIATERRAFWTNDLADESWVRDPDQVRRERLVGFAGFPLVASDRLLGVIGLFSRRPFDQNDLTALATLADQLAVAIEKARLLKRLHAALQLREEFIAAAAHELRTPITGLKGYVGLIRKLPRTDTPEVDRALGAIETTSNRIARLAGDLVEAAELERGALRLSPEPSDLAEVARQVVQEAQDEAPRHVFRVDASPAPVVADRSRIAEVIRHFLDNAVKYQPDGGTIDVVVRTADNEAMLTVRDHGPGIPPERLPNVFEPMYEPLPPGAAGYVGVVGLGLGISKGIVEQHDGRIWADSEPGRGSSFHFALPLAPLAKGR